MPPLPNAAVVMGVQGPIARSAEDLDLALSVLAGPDVGEDVAWRVELPPARHDRLADFRVAVLPPIPWVAVDDQITTALDALATRLGRLGCHRRPGPARGLRRPSRALPALPVAAVRDDERARDRRAAAAAHRMYRKAGDEFSLAHLRGLDGSPSDFVLWNGQRERYRESWRAFFREWDVLLAPAINVLAYPHIERAWPAGQRLGDHLTLDGLAIPYLHGLVYPSLSTVAGQPATAFPTGISRDGLPIGLQAVGPYLEDRTPIRFAALLAGEIGGFRKPPGFDAS